MSTLDTERRSSRDWRDGASYEDLNQLDRRGFAWEYLRRNERFRRERQESGADEEARALGTLIVKTAPEPVALDWGLRFRRTRRHGCPGSAPVLA